MKHKELHWETASEKQKVGYLISALGLKPEVPMHAFGLQLAVRFLFSEEQLMRMSFVDVADIINKELLRKRNALMEEIDGLLATIAEIKAL